MTGLNSEEMSLVSSLFQEANAFVNDGASKGTRENIQTLFLKLSMEDIPPMLLTTAGAAILQKEVFGNEFVRDYILKLSFVFFSRWAASDDMVVALTHNLARGLTQSPYPQLNHADTLVPDAIYERLPTRTDVQQLLAKNPWLIVILLVPLFISASAYREPVH